jgi:3-carboxy-cis,cis-muconate cycloisomerase
VLAAPGLNPGMNPGSNPLYADLFGDGETAALFDAGAEIAALLRVEGALALAQADLGLIPASAAAAIAGLCADTVIDPAELAAATATNGVPVPGLVALLRRAGPPEATQYLHWGATSQDVADTGLALRLSALLDLFDARLAALAAALGRLADAHAGTAMAARTYGQAAVPTSFGAVVAAWGWPLLAHRAALAALAPRLLRVSLGGAAGTLSAMGPQGPAVRAALAGQLGLADPGHSWHSQRDGIAALAGTLAGLAASLGKMGADLILLTQSGIAEVRIDGAGGSSTMPQKQNPVGPSVLVALSHLATGLCASLHAAALHRQQRDGAAWFTEWLALPPLCLAAGRGLALAIDLAGRITPDADAMQRGLAADGGLIHAEALSFALSARMPRSEAQGIVAALCARVRAGEGALPDLAATDFPTLALPAGGLGTAPDEARAFARASRS